MTWTIFIFVLSFFIILFFSVAIAFIKNNAVGGYGGIGFPYQRGKPLFSAAERSFLGVLDQAVGPDHRVFGKVRIADLAAVKLGLSRAAWQGALNRIAFKHFDFVVCRCSDLSVVCAIELNDQSHSSQRAQARDALVADVCKTIQLPLLVVPAKSSYSLQDVRAQFLSAISPAQHDIRSGN
jgi:Protein of unknown function (DUF2726)